MALTSKITLIFPARKRQNPDNFPSSNFTSPLSAARPFIARRSARRGSGASVFKKSSTCLPARTLVFIQFVNVLELHLARFVFPERGHELFVAEQFHRLIQSFNPVLGKIKADNLAMPRNGEAGIPDQQIGRAHV